MLSAGKCEKRPFATGQRYSHAMSRASARRTRGLCRKPHEVCSVSRKRRGELEGRRLASASSSCSNPTATDGSGPRRRMKRERTSEKGAPGSASTSPCNASSIAGSTSVAPLMPTTHAAARSKQRAPPVSPARTQPTAPSTRLADPLRASRRAASKLALPQPGRGVFRAQSEAGPMPCSAHARAIDTARSPEAPARTPRAHASSMKGEAAGARSLHARISLSTSSPPSAEPTEQLSATARSLHAAAWSPRAEQAAARRLRGLAAPGASEMEQVAAARAASCLCSSSKADAVLAWSLVRRDFGARSRKMRANSAVAASPFASATPTS
mmetsp:Transcript_35273/g.113391  ORF Transcript_35273/g.113391 Transcript_35273/m.113391 type:complete len:326 (-) Transcript_35273:160-1137(-)